jgi:hypothetical protein
VALQRGRGARDGTDAEEGLGRVGDCEGVFGGFCERDEDGGVEGFCEVGVVYCECVWHGIFLYIYI